MSGKMIEAAGRSSKRWVSSGPQFWVACHLHQNGPSTTSNIWEAYSNDKEVEIGTIRSKNHLKDKILRDMLNLKKVERTPVDDPDYTRNLGKNGFKLVYHKAFKNVPLDVILALEPAVDLSLFNRQDIREVRGDFDEVEEEQEEQKQTEELDLENETITLEETKTEDEKKK
eukprot:CAMPEP_0114985780 /NCGR_PEP_ID=MMETSP0216-20121206/8060_1 /TAXON_ID=223996 /ORGANISM="Protocruzia adherens, Strain Boccale" /LENGTH=170 /DNA_ID=CAMNT_0002348141 /DNA_START=21 /DNA_END=533 /DNA_ORIENTATION=+